MKLADDSYAAGTQGHSQRHFRLPRCCTRQQQVGHIHDYDQKQSPIPASNKSKALEMMRTIHSFIGITTATMS